MASLISEADTSTPGRRSVDALRNELPSFGAEAARAGHGDDENADSVETDAPSTIPRKQTNRARTSLAMALHADPSGR